MAIDTRAKRFSIMNLGRIPSTVQFEADSSVDADDRSHLLRLYGGIALDNPVAPTFHPSYARNLNTLIGSGFTHV